MKKKLLGLVLVTAVVCDCEGMIDAINLQLATANQHLANANALLAQVAAYESLAFNLSHSARLCAPAVDGGVQPFREALGRLYLYQPGGMLENEVVTGLGGRMIDPANAAMGFDLFVLFAHVLNSCTKSVNAAPAGTVNGGPQGVEVAGYGDDIRARVATPHNIAAGSILSEYARFTEAIGATYMPDPHHYCIAAQAFPGPANTRSKDAIIEGLAGQQAQANLYAGANAGAAHGAAGINLNDARFLAVLLVFELAEYGTINNTNLDHAGATPALGYGYVTANGIKLLDVLKQLLASITE